MVPEGIKKVAVLCVLKQGEQFLLLKRLKEPNKGMYTPVGGKLDPFETPLQAAVRETFEETGLKADHLRYGGMLTETSPTKYNWISFVYVAEIEQVAPPPCNEGTLEWIGFSEVLQVPTPTSDWYIYKYLLEGRPFAFDAIYDEHLQLLRMSDELTGELVYDKRSC